MPECDYCKKQFETDHRLHLHWGEKHEDELTSHENDQSKRAKRQQQEEQEQRRKAMKERRKTLAITLGTAVTVALLGFFLFQHLSIRAPTSGKTVSFDLKGQPILGNASAPVTVVEFGDYKCPACARFHRTAYKNLKTEYIEKGKVQYVFMQYPFIASDSQTAAIASECMLEQDKEAFWSYHDALYKNQGPEYEKWATIDRLMDLAREATQRINYTDLRTCIEEQETQSQVHADKVTGQQVGIPGTPAIYVNGRLLDNWNGDYLKQAVELELAS